MNEARVASREQIPQVEYQVSVLERAGLSKVDVEVATPNASLSQLAATIDKQYWAVPERVTREVERGLRQERDRDRWRESIPMGGL